MGQSIRAIGFIPVFLTQSNDISQKWYKLSSEIKIIEKILFNREGKMGEGGKIGEMGEKGERGKLTLTIDLTDKKY